jgi:hypothetical protein
MMRLDITLESAAGAWLCSGEYKGGWEAKHFAQSRSSCADTAHTAHIQALQREQRNCAGREGWLVQRGAERLFERRRRDTVMGSRMAE